MQFQEDQIKLIYKEEKRGNVPILNIHINTNKKEHEEQLQKFVNKKQKEGNQIEIDLKEFFPQS